MSRISQKLVCFVLVCIPWAAGIASADETWVGKKVFLKPGVKLRMKEQEVDATAIAQYPAAVTGVDGRRLLLGEYWVNDNEVLTLEQQAAVHVVRGRAMHGRGEYDAALAEFETAARLDPNNASVFNSRGQMYVAMKKLDLAIKDFGEAIRVAPRDAAGYLSRASAYRSNGDIDTAMKDYDKLIEMEPKKASHYSLRAAATRSKGDLAGAIRDLSKAIEFSPKNPSLYVSRAYALRDDGQVDAARADFDKAVEIVPTNLAYYKSRAEFLRANGKTGEAEESFAKLIEQRTQYIHANPDKPLGYTSRAAALVAKHDFAGALADYSKAIELDASFAYSYNDRAWLRATCAAAEIRDGQQAVQDATKACELTSFRNASFLETLAAAHAEAGQFDKAMEWQTKALEAIVPNQYRIGATLERSSVEARLELYRQHKPYRAE